MLTYRGDCGDSNVRKQKLFQSVLKRGSGGGTASSQVVSYETFFIFVSVCGRHHNQFTSGIQCTHTRAHTHGDDAGAGCMQGRWFILNNEIMSGGTYSEQNKCKCLYFPIFEEFTTIILTSRMNIEKLVLYNFFLKAKTLRFFN